MQLCIKQRIEFYTSIPTHKSLPFTFEHPSIYSVHSFITWQILIRHVKSLGQLFETGHKQAISHTVLNMA